MPTPMPRTPAAEEARSGRFAGPIGLLWENQICWLQPLAVCLAGLAFAALSRLPGVSSGVTMLLDLFCPPAPFLYSPW
jgi:hypothetical protein